MRRSSRWVRLHREIHTPQPEEGEGVSKRWLSAALIAVITGSLALGAGLVRSSAAAPAADTRVGLVSDVGRFNDKSFNQSALEGLKRAEKVLKISTRAVESRAASDYIPNLSTL